jgi:cytochrome b6-f complex iron-sulfur subunit
MDMDHKKANGKKTRRNFLKVLWVSLGLAALGELILLIVSFFRPISKKQAVGFEYRVIDAGNMDAYEPGTVSTFVRGQFYLVRLEDGGFLAMSGKCTHLGCAVPWDKDRKKFVCPCHSSEFDISGNVLSSPAPRALDLFEINIVNKNIQVDIGKRIRRNRFNKSQLVYPETVGVLEASTRK